MVELGQTLTHYRFAERLGEGSGGVVWRALDTETGAEVAIKLLPDAIAASRDAMARLEREARVLASLHHPNIVSVFGIEEAGAQRLLVMELLRGAPLDALIPPAGLPFGRLLELAVPLADALAAAHERGVVHRDLKPANVIVGPGGRPTIVDFGIAAVRPAPATDIAMLETVTLAGCGRLFGTLPYMAPEQVRGNHVDRAADVFSFGVLLYEMATGARPFKGATPAELAASILRDDPEPVTALRADLPPELDRIVERCLDKEPRYRFRATGDLRDELQHLQACAPAVPAHPGRSVAVLPFADLGPEQDQDYFCEGLAAEVIVALGRVAGLRVAPRTASFRFHGSSLPSRELGRRLHVRALLSGSVRRTGSRLRVMTALVDAPTGFELWSQAFDGRLGNVFAMQEEIASSVARALEVPVSRSERDALRRTPTSDVRAYDCWLRARRFYYQYRRRGVELARDLYQRALEIDAAFARAWAGLADCHCFFFLYVERVAANIERAEACSRKALELDPELAEARASWGVALSIAGRDDEAVAAFEEAIRLDPALFEARYFYARHSFARGHLERALDLYRQAEALRPEDYQAPLLMAQIEQDLGHDELAHAAYRRGLRKAEAVLLAEPEDGRARYMAANALVALGERGRGLAWARQAIDLEPDEPMLLYNVGCIFAMAGETRAALDALERSVARGLTQRGWFEHDSNLDSLREEPRFEALVAGLP